MTTIFKVQKVVSTLPSILEPNTIYAVRVGEGFDLYTSDSTGTIAHKINNTVNYSPINYSVVNNNTDTHLGAIDSLLPNLEKLDSPLNRLINGDVFDRFITGNTLYVSNVVFSNGVNYTNAAFRASRVYFYPFIFRKNLTLDKVGLTVVNTSVDTYKFSLYEEQGNNLNQILPEIIVDATTTGYKEFNCSLTVSTNKIYYLSFRASIDAASSYGKIRCFFPVYLKGQFLLILGGGTDIYRTHERIILNNTLAYNNSLSVVYNKSETREDYDNFGHYTPYILFRVANIL